MKSMFLMTPPFVSLPVLGVLSLRGMAAEELREGLPLLRAHRDCCRPVRVAEGMDLPGESEAASRPVPGAKNHEGCEL